MYSSDRRFRVGPNSSDSRPMPAGHGSSFPMLSTPSWLMENLTFLCLSGPVSYRVSPEQVRTVLRDQFLADFDWRSNYAGATTRPWRDLGQRRSSPTNGSFPSPAESVSQTDFSPTTDPRLLTTSTFVFPVAAPLDSAGASRRNAVQRLPLEAGRRYALQVTTPRAPGQRHAACCVHDPEWRRHQGIDARDLQRHSGGADEPARPKPCGSFASPRVAARNDSNVAGGADRRLGLLLLGLSGSTWRDAAHDCADQ